MILVKESIKKFTKSLGPAVDEHCFLDAGSIIDAFYKDAECRKLSKGERKINLKKALKEAKLDHMIINIDSCNESTHNKTKKKWLPWVLCKS